MIDTDSSVQTDSKISETFISTIGRSIRVSKMLSFHCRCTDLLRDHNFLRIRKGLFQPKLCQYNSLWSQLLAGTTFKIAINAKIICVKFWRPPESKIRNILVICMSMYIQIYLYIYDIDIYISSFIVKMCYYFLLRLILL